MLRAYVVVPEFQGFFHCVPERLDGAGRVPYIAPGRLVALAWLRLRVRGGPQPVLDHITGEANVSEHLGRQRFGRFEQGKQQVLGPDPPLPEISRACSVASRKAARARSVKRSSVAVPGNRGDDGTVPENRLWAACLLTPRAELISDHVRPSARHDSTKWSSKLSLSCSISLTLRAA